MVLDDQISELYNLAVRAIPEVQRKPVSVYRLNFSSSFTFNDAADIVPYLHDLGITDCYSSPYLKASAGSRHGYDITDHNHLNPEIGSPEDYERFICRLREYDMGQILDFVPNHMGIFGNPRWQDVLQNGRTAASAHFFDIFWDPVKPELKGKVLLPILEDFYGNVLQSGLIRLNFDKGSFFVSYRDHLLPVGRDALIVVLEACLTPLQEALGHQHRDYLEFRDIVSDYKGLAARLEPMFESISEICAEESLIRGRLREICACNATVSSVLESVVEAFNSDEGKDMLHSLLEKQSYRLSYWRTGREEINYRRFFDINNLVAVRMEDPAVFEETHRLVRQLLRQGAVTGIRIDHIDGLYDPADYLWRLQKAHWLDLVMAEVSADAKMGKLPRDLLESKMLELFEQVRERNPASPFVRPVFLIVEKILNGKEELRSNWPVAGTVGYEYAASLNRLFTNGENGRIMLDIYRRFTGNNLTFAEITYRSKLLMMRTSMYAEVDMLAHWLVRIAEKSWRYRDFTLKTLRDAIREVIACFPVYRTYVEAYRGLIDEADTRIINEAVAQARRHNLGISSQVFTFIQNILLLRYAPDMDEEKRSEICNFVMRFQQFTGPVMAKGLEDTALYIFNPLVSLNEVGASPLKFSISAAEFHRQNRQRHKEHPHALITTSTHDSKRSEDVRARLNVLSEIPEKWGSALKRWNRLNRDKKSKIPGKVVPDGNDEYLLYQTLLGTYPVADMDKQAGVTYCSRIQQYMQKALREAKVHSDWADPDAAYEETVADFVKSILDISCSGDFLEDFRAFLRPLAVCGIYNSLSQTVLKCFSPGVPDVYQGNELWNYILTDPDNRQPVDFSQRLRLLRQMKQQAGAAKDLSAFVRNLLEAVEDGAIKLYITWKSLNYRRSHKVLFDTGRYLPLRIEGREKDHACAFAWRNKEYITVVVVPRLIAGLTGFASIEPLGTGAWGGTILNLPRRSGTFGYRNIFTGEVLSLQDIGGKLGLSMADVFASCPVAVLESVIAESRGLLHLHE
jgi:(1->4)-alpha-D-glucan 1-alpha-D-glucosylmutase